MPEKITIGENPEQNQFNKHEYHELLSRVKDGVDIISPQDRERLIKFGNHWLDAEQNAYSAMRTFEAVQDFVGLRKVADFLLRERPDSDDLPRVLTDLEDYEGICNLLNREDVEFSKYSYEQAFYSLDQPLCKYIRKFLEENNTPVATGGVNIGIDLIAIRNLAKEYDVAVPIARGGLKQGAIAKLWDMPTRTVDIAAHKRKVARGKWITPVAPEDFNGKRVLLFDKDAVSGASVRKVVSMLGKFQTESVGIYFTHPVLSPGVVGIGTITSGLPEGLEIFSPKNASMERAGDVYLEAHEKLETLYGRRRKVERQFIEEAEKLQEKFPQLAEEFRKFADEQCRAFDSLNPNLSGVTEVREQILLKMNQLFRDHQGYLKNKMYDLPGFAENIGRILVTSQGLPLEFESELVKARYRKKQEEIAQRRNIENMHYPSNPLAAFNTARKAVKEGFNVALIVGPEGFAYEPYFQDLGISTLAVNIPESSPDEPRTIELLDDLSKLQGKKVLVVEDDVRTGATLQKLLEHLQPNNPASLGLYLGQPEQFQKIANIPESFEDKYLAEEGPMIGKEFEEYLDSRNLKIFKTVKTS
jgi:hypoxanthine phosphoribosyltransferase